MFKILNRDQIPYVDQAGRLFNLTGGQLNNDGIQRIVRFLGAGVSISGRQHPPHPSIDSLGSVNLESIFGQLGLEGKAKVFLEMAILLAYLMQSWEQQESAAPREGDGDLLTKLQQDVYPPSAGELAKLFSQLANYSTFKAVVRRLRGKFPDHTFGAGEEHQVEALKLLANVTG